MIKKCEKCSNPVEWADRFCQEHWEQYCSEVWWDIVPKLQDELMAGEEHD